MSEIIPNPKTKKWIQENNGDVLGTLFATRNISFNDKGYAKLARRSTALIYNKTNFGGVMSIQTLDANTYLVVTDSQLQSCILTSGTPTSLNGTGHAGSIFFDGITWQNRWYVSQASDFAYYDGSSWTTGLGSLGGSNKYHPLCVHLGLNQLAVGEDNKVLLFSSSHSLITTITLPLNYQVRWIRYNNNNLYIGTKNLSGGEAEVFVADGSTTAWNSSSTVSGCQWAFSGEIYKGVLVIIASNGQLLKQNGSGWDELARLPIYNQPSSAWYDGNGYTAGKVAQRGTAVKGERIYLNIDGYVNNADGTQLVEQPSGLWIYDPDVGLYHHAGLATDSYLGTIASSSVNTSTNVITTGSTIPRITSTKVVAFTSSCTGIIAGRYYYLIYLSPTTYKLASNYNNALAGTAVSLGSGTAVTISGSENQSFGEWMNNSYQPGAILLINDLNSTLSTYYSSSASQILFGAGNVNSYTGTQSYTLQTLTMGENRGTFITTKIFSAAIKDTWQALFTKYNKLFQGNDKIVVKHRTSEVENYPLFSGAQLMWATATSFTSTFDFSQVSVGDEVEFVSGRGAGCSAHIISATFNSGTWTVIIDEAIVGVTVSDISTGFFVNNWKKRNTIVVPNTVDGYSRTADEGQSKWLQLKIEIRGVSEPYIEELDTLNKTLMPIA